MTMTADVLVVDDDANIRELVADILGRAGARVNAIGSGLDALRILRLYQPTVLVTDIFMPDTDGLEIIRAAQEMSPYSKIIAMSGGDMRYGNFLRAAKLLGADAILDKPFNRSELLRAVALCLKDSSEGPPACFVRNELPNV